MFLDLALTILVFYGVPVGIVVYALWLLHSIATDLKAIRQRGDREHVSTTLS